MGSSEAVSKRTDIPNESTSTEKAEQEAGITPLFEQQVINKKVKAILTEMQKEINYFDQLGKVSWITSRNANRARTQAESLQRQYE
jgi:hypothetical protein